MASVEFIGSRSVYRHERFDLAEETFRTPVGEVVRPVIHHPGAVALVVRPDPDHLVLLRQYRYPLRDWIWEIPAGTMHPQEDPADAAVRELAEETGLRAGRWTFLFAFHPAVGASDELMHLFLAEDLSAGEADPDHGELIGQRAWTRAEVAAARAAGTAFDAKTLVALAWLGWWPCAGEGA